MVYKTRLFTPFKEGEGLAQLDVAWKNEYFFVAERNAEYFYVGGRLLQAYHHKYLQRTHGKPIQWTPLPEDAEVDVVIDKCDSAWE